jgi:hypothetical protein
MCGLIDMNLTQQPYTPYTGFNKNAKLLKLDDMLGALNNNIRTIRIKGKHGRRIPMIDNFKKMFVLLLIVSVFSFGVVGCTSSDESASDEPASVEQTSDQQSTEEHPADEHPTEEHPSDEHPE